MSRALAVLLAISSLTACSKTEPTSSAADGAASPSATASAATKPAAAAKDVPSVAKAWNDAMAKRDTDALAAIYGPQVNFYGTTMPNDKVVAAKKAAFARSPDYTQTIGTLQLDPVQNGVTVVHFTKTSTEKGKSKDFPARLGIADGHVVEENDDATQNSSWCLDSDFEATEKVVPPFKLSARRAVEEVVASKRFATLSKHFQSFGPSDRGVSCPKDCADRNADRQTCDFEIGLGEVGKSPATEMYVDPVTGEMWFQDGDQKGSPWISEKPSK